jgi:hypothetical protein
VNVLQLNLEDGLAIFGDNSFDVVLQIDTLQHLRNAEVMLQETARIGKQGVVAFPNFAHWQNRFSCCAGACRSRVACLTSGMTRRISGWAPTRTSRCWPPRTACAFATPSVCKTVRWWEPAQSVGDNGGVPLRACLIAALETVITIHWQ